MSGVNLQALQNQLREAQAGGSSCIRSSKCPAKGEYFHVRGSIVCPAAGADETVIVGYTVPDGFTGVINAILNVYIGAGPPVEGDAAQLFFSIRINRNYYARDFGEITTSLGSLSAGPYPVPGGMILAAGMLVEYTVTVPAGSPVATGDTNRVHGHLLGSHWPEAV